MTREAMHVLLVEDDPDVALLICDMLASEPDLEVHSAERLSKGLALLSFRKIDIVVLDLGLPDSQGIETLRRVIRSNDSIPVVVLTGRSDEEVGELAVREGAQDYLVKGKAPPSDIIRAIRYAIERKRAENRHLEQCASLNAEIRCQLDELGRWQGVMLDREDRVQVLKREVNELCGRTGEPNRYSSQEEVPDEPVPLDPDRDRAGRSRRSMLSAMEDQRQAEAIVKIRNQELETLYGVARELAATRSGPECHAFIIRKLKEITGGASATFGLYDPVKKQLRVKHSGLDDGVTGDLVRALGNGLLSETVLPISDEMHHLLTTTLTKSISTLREAGLGIALPFPDPLIRNVEDLYRFLGVTYLAQGELLGTSLVALRKDAPDPPLALVHSFAEMVAVSLHRDRAEEALLENEQRLRLITDNARDTIWLMDLGMRTTWISPSVTRARGHTLAELAEMPLDRHLTPGSMTRMVELSSAVLTPERLADPNAEIAVAEEFEFYRSDGSTFWSETVIALLRDHQGRPSGFLGVGRDVSDRRRAEEALRQSEEKFQKAFQTAPFAITITRALDGRLIEVNDAFVAMSGYSREEALASSSLSLALWGDKRDRQGVVSALQAGQRVVSGEYPFRIKDGGIIIGSFSARAIQLSGEACILSSINDVTAHRRAEAERERLTTAIEQAAEVTLVTDARGIIVYVNPAFESVTGYSRVEAMGKSPRILKSGQQDQAFYRQLWETISGGSTWRGRMVNRRKDGRLYTEEATISPVRNVLGTITSYVAVKRDITRDLALEEHVLQSQKMESVGRLAGGVAHDFNNLLSVILGNTGFALEAIQEGDPLREDLLEIQKAGERAASLTSQLLAFSRKQVLQPRLIDLNRILIDMERMLRRILGEDIDLVQILAPDLGSLKADPGQIEQVIMNLVANARDAMHAGGRLTIETSNVDLDAESAALNPDTEPGPYVMLAFADSGIGMDKRTAAQIFEPFYTTKGRGKGTGLGLSTVFGIVKQSHGSISVDSEPGRGTTFKIIMPREVAVPIPREDSRSVATGSVGTEKILLVEDDDAVRILARRILQSAGYIVMAASNGGEALTVVEAHPAEIDLVLTDVVMPQMSGKTFVERLAKIRPGIKVIYMSGYTDDAIVHHGVLDPGTTFIGKPFAATDLLRKVREVLDSGKSPEVAEPARPACSEPEEAASDGLSIGTIPRDVLDRLHKATIAARYEEIVETIRIIGLTAPQAAIRLRGMAESFDYEGIRSFLGA